MDAQKAGYGTKDRTWEVGTLTIAMRGILENIQKDKGEECSGKRIRMSNCLIRRHRLTGEIRNGWAKWKKRHGGPRKL
jgi:hypothetical protein